MNALFSLPELPGDAHTVLRLQENLQRTVTLSSGQLTENTRKETRGVSALLWHNGKRGFSSTSDVSEVGVRLALAEAQQNLDALSPNRSAITAAAPQQFTYSAPRNDAAQAELLELAREVDARLQTRCAGLTGRNVQLETLGTEKQVWTGEGRSEAFLLPRTNLYLTLTAEDRNGKPVTIRDSIGGIGFQPQVISDASAADTLADALYEDLMQKRCAKPMDYGELPCVLSGCTGILIHEAFGHIAEGDSVLAGSVLSGKLGQQLVSPLISATDFANTAFGAAVPQPRFLDDEGVVCVDAPLLKDGVLVGYMHNRSTAAALGCENTGNAWANLYSDLPVVRMRNTAIHPGTSSLEEMIASLDRGIFVKRTGGGQADQTGKFMFSVQCAYAIEHGKLTHALPDLVCQGNSFRTLKEVTMVGNSIEWRHSSMCGKKGQVICVGMSGPALCTTASFYGG